MRPAASDALYISPYDKEALMITKACCIILSFDAEIKKKSDLSDLIDETKIPIRT